MSNFLPLRIPTEPRWKPYHKNLVLSLPRNVRGWLLDPSSLTSRLIKASHNHFCVQVLRQAYGKPLLSEARRLDLKQNQWVLIREVALLCHNEPWVYARSIIPRSTLVNGQHPLKTMGAKPLGAALFKDPSMHRKVVDIANIPILDLPPHIKRVSHDQSRKTQNPSDSVWGRRSLFNVGGQDLLVAEIFLPKILNVKHIEQPINRRFIRY